MRQRCLALAAVAAVMLAAAVGPVVAQQMQVATPRKAVKRAYRGVRSAATGTVMSCRRPLCNAAGMWQQAQRTD